MATVSPPFVRTAVTRIGHDARHVQSRRASPDRGGRPRCPLQSITAPAVPSQLPGDRSEWRWYKGNTHTHTLQSDGDSTPDEVTRWYKERGYHFLVLSDHNVLTPIAELARAHAVPEQFLLVPARR